ncbi:MAG: hypothetical protein LBR94_00810 [Desulfovibrio sp.]|jgi:hypothetical protein|nr:hypothetical protein [Desulfovibrio sp.]
MSNILPFTPAAKLSGEDYAGLTDSHYLILASLDLEIGMRAFKEACREKRQRSALDAVGRMNRAMEKINEVMGND